MHDINELDRRGVPGGMVATQAFEHAARAQSEILGLSPAIVYIPHPVQNLSDGDIRALADSAFDDVLNILHA